MAEYETEEVNVPDMLPLEVDADPRFSSGVPPGQRRDAQQFVEMSGLIRKRPEVPPRPAVVERATADFYEAGVVDVDPAMTPDGLERSAVPQEDEVLRQRRLESSSRLLEAEQLLQALERQPREIPAEEVAPPEHEASGAPISEEEPFAVPAEEAQVQTPAILPAPLPIAAVRRPGRLPQLLRFLTTAAVFAVVAYLVAQYLVALVRIPAPPSHFDELPQVDVVSPPPRLEPTELVTEPETVEQEIDLPIEPLQP